MKTFRDCFFILCLLKRILWSVSKMLTDAIVVLLQSVCRRTKQQLR